MPLLDDEPTGDTSSIDADALLAEIEKASPERDARSESTAPESEAPPVKETPETSPTLSEIEFTWNGKKIKAPIDKAKQWAQQGYDYAQKMQEFGASKQAWETERKRFEESLAPYRLIDEFAKSNPDWWKQVEQSYQERMSSAQSNPELSQLRQELSELKKFKDSLETERQEARRKEEDEKLKTEIQSIRDEFKDLNWDQPDDSGQTLEKRVLMHAMENGIASFRAAFRDYNHEHLLKLAEERAKESKTKDIQKRTKEGLLGVSPTPKKALAPAENVKSKSYDDLLREAKEEFGLA